MIYKNLRVQEIIKIIQTNKYLYNSIKIDMESLATIKKCVAYDFGDTLACKKFKIPHTTSLELMKNV